MSRIGKLPILIEDVSVVQDGQRLLLTGSKGSLVVTVPEYISITINDNKTIQLAFLGNTHKEKEKAMFGTIRQAIFNAVHGIVSGYEKRLKLFGIGYEIEDKGEKIRLRLGYSHDSMWNKKSHLQYFVLDKTTLKITGICKNSVSQEAASIRSLKRPDSYDGKGIRYEGEVLNLKEKKKA